LIQIRRMTKSDVAFAISLTDHEGWGNLSADFHRLIALSHDGCFVACRQDKPLGMVTTTIHADYAFMGSLIVKPDHRGRGVGESLMRHAVEYLDSFGVACIELDATLAAAPLYRRLGFLDKYLSLRFRRHPDAGATPCAPPTRKTLAAAELDMVIGIDARLTGLDRRAVLARLAGEFSDSIYLDAAASKGFAFVYPRAGRRVAVGPIVAEDFLIAGSLLDKIIGDYGEYEISIGVPQSNDAGSLIMSRGFVHTPPSLRMYRGQKRLYEQHVFAIVSPEKG